MDVILATVITHDPVVCDPTLGRVTTRFTLRHFAMVNYASTHTLVERPSHSQPILLIVDHALCVCFARSTELVLVVAAVATCLVQDPIILGALVSCD